MEEKNALRERLVSYMEYHPLPSGMKAVKSVHESALTDPVMAPASEVLLPAR
jgi:hypothetical protein